MRLSAVLASVLGLLGVGCAQAANPVVVMETSYGTIKIELFEDHTPISAKNFLDYTDSKFYDGLIFHRVTRRDAEGRGINVIQGGGFSPGNLGKEKETKKPIKNEAKLSNKRGTIAMARTDEPDSATSQFYINVEDNTQLDPKQGSAGYCVFGRVIEGMDVVDKIGKVRTASAAGHNDVPVEDIVIKSVKRVAK